MRGEDISTFWVLVERGLKDDTPRHCLHMSYSQYLLHHLLDIGAVLGTILGTVLNYTSMTTLENPSNDSPKS